ncbi:MAG: hypothetical protein QGG40_18635, partial [Myxococcota bacterium]|nr:hypothetical protein [Myxococcota bacterium]
MSRRPDTDLSSLQALWTPVTIRVAWVLVKARIKLRPAVLTDVRDHVFFCLPSGAGVDEAEHLASLYALDYLDRVRTQRYQRPSSHDLAASDLPLDWRPRIRKTLDPVGAALLRMHYGDGLPLDRTSRDLGTSQEALDVARTELRESLRTIAVQDGFPVHRWQDDRVDAFASRVAGMVEGGCPRPAGLLSDAGRSHAANCPRCSRGVRLVREGMLSPSDLRAPDEHPAIEERIEVL